VQGDAMARIAATVGYGAHARCRQG
jgi:hypothetical protein